MREAHEANDGIATLATKRVKDTTQFGVVITGEDGRIQGFQEKPDPAEALSDLANCGIYMFRREIFDYFPEPGHRSPAGDEDQPDGFVDWAMDVFPALLEGDVAFHAHEIEAYWNDIGSVSELVQGNADALSGLVSLRGSGEESGRGRPGRRRLRDRRRRRAEGARRDRRASQDRRRRQAARRGGAGRRRAALAARSSSAASSAPTRPERALLARRCPGAWGGGYPRRRPCDRTRSRWG